MLATQVPYSGFFSNNCQSNTCKGAPNGLDMLEVTSLKQSGTMTLQMNDKLNGVVNTTFSGTWVDAGKMKF